MKYLRLNTCAVCGDAGSEGGTRFLLAENRWQDKLTILEWNEQAASRTSLQVACSIEHAEVLVVHWVATGSLNHPFARTVLGSGGWRSSAGLDFGSDFGGAREVGSLTVHRETIESLLPENAGSIQQMVDKLMEPLRIMRNQRRSNREEYHETDEVCMAL